MLQLLLLKSLNIFFFLLVQKETKKTPKSITARFRVGSLIKLLCYAQHPADCDFSIGNPTLRFAQFIFY